MTELPPPSGTPLKTPATSWWPALRNLAIGGAVMTGLAIAADYGAGHLGIDTDGRPAPVEYRWTETACGPDGMSGTLRNPADKAFTGTVRAVAIRDGAVIDRATVRVRDLRRGETESIEFYWDVVGDAPFHCRFDGIERR